ncbi:hypothetical protein STENM327S_01224 [Streptomyces tendae]
MPPGPCVWPSTTPSAARSTPPPGATPGAWTTVGLAPLPPVAYPNRYATAGQVGALRFAGDYYVVVHLAAQVADDFGQGPFGLTLRLRSRG